MKFEIPYPPTKKGKAAWNKRFGLNAYYAGKHWSKRKQDAEELHTLAILCMKKAHIRRQMVKGPVEIRFYWNDGLDCDNHAAMALGAYYHQAGVPTPAEAKEQGIGYDKWEELCRSAGV